ncbi:MAG: L-ribulose-5-phosphate 4-epimerase AraD [Candidatus Hydrogenedentes bacterium]|nr:L-ribulose-5-phosphate 4-epimerase AraD [Candidatus Hydrogenedentota bacterium]
MSIADLKKAVCDANLDLVFHGLVKFTFGNASAIDREAGRVVIKPSGVPYEKMKPRDMVVVDLAGQVVEGDLKPSVDLPTHLALYEAFPSIGGIAHAHSHYATAWAQACRAIPCLGTTHADYFRGEVPVTTPLTHEDVNGDYEHAIGASIARAFTGRDPLECSAVLVANHAPFAWGATVADAVEHARVLEEAAALALHTLAISPGAPPVPGHLLDKHFLRKHGNAAYYGQRR